MVSTLLGGSGVVASAPKKKGGSGGSETCHFCAKRVYVVERMSAEGRFFHRSCFRCDYCNILLRLGSYVYHREGPFEGKEEEKWNKGGGNESVFDSLSSLFCGVCRRVEGGRKERKKGMIYCTKRNFFCATERRSIFLSAADASSPRWHFQLAFLSPLLLRPPLISFS